MEFNHTISIDDTTLVFMKKIDDPFLSCHVRIHWLDRLKSLFTFRKYMTVIVSVGGDREAIFKVMNLDKATFPFVKGSAVDG